MKRLGGCWSEGAGEGVGKRCLGWVQEGHGGGVEVGNCDGWDVMGFGANFGSV